MPIIKEYFENGDFSFEEHNVYYYFFINKGVLCIHDTNESELEYLPIRENDNYGIQSWANSDKCWTPFTDDVQRLYQGWKAEQALLK